MFVVNGNSPIPFIFEVNPATGAFVKSFNAPARFNKGGIAFDGQYVYYATEFNDTLYKLNPDTGTSSTRRR